MFTGKRTPVRSATLLAGIVAAILAGALGMPSLLSYADHTTHRILTERAIQLAKEVGPTTGAYLPGASYSEIEKFAVELIRGTVEEDAPTRFMNHFYDPGTGKGLVIDATSTPYEYWEFRKNPDAVRGLRAPDGRFYLDARTYAREGTPDGMDWMGAIAKYDYSDAAKKEAYEALGHVLHLLQDMAQPDHASSNRPHPGNYLWSGPFFDTRNYLLSGAAGRLPAEWGGYEKFWSLHRWPYGQSDRMEQYHLTFHTFDARFREVALESRRLEGVHGVKRQWEVAMGLENKAMQAISISWLPTSLRTVAVEVAGGSMQIPTIPLVPNPQGADADAAAREKAYLAIGEALLPYAEEQSAALLQTFLDIVRHPPYVREIQVWQAGELRYWATWEDEWDEMGRVASRRLIKQRDRPLIPGVDGEIRLQLGPYGNSDDIQAWGFTTPHEIQLRPASGEMFYQEEPPRFENGWLIQPVLFQKGGVLEILAEDQFPRFFQRTMPSHEYVGSQLDSDPATPAKTVSTPGYPWSGYEPGADVNHELRFATTISGLCREPVREIFGTSRGLASGTEGGELLFEPSMRSVATAVLATADHESQDANQTEAFEPASIECEPFESWPFATWTKSLDATATSGGNQGSSTVAISIQAPADPVQQGPFRARLEVVAEASGKNIDVREDIVWGANTGSGEAEAQACLPIWIRTGREMTVEVTATPSVSGSAEGEDDVLDYSYGVGDIRGSDFRNTPGALEGSPASESESVEVRPPGRLLEACVEGSVNAKASAYHEHWLRRDGAFQASAKVKVTLDVTVEEVGRP